MKYSQKQIRYILKSGGRNINNAIIKDGQVFINDITLAPALRSDNVVFTYRGTPINLSLDTENRRRFYIVHTVLMAAVIVYVNFFRIYQTN